MADDRDFTSYVAARWTHVVRCLLAVGAPLDLAHRVAADALSSCHDDWASRDDWIDLDVHVFGELLHRWDRQPGRWWDRPARPSDVEALDEAGWPEVEAELDRMPVPERRALILSEVAGLDLAQVREVTGVDWPVADPALVTALLDALDLVPVEGPRVEAMVAASEHRRRRRRGASLAGGVALLAVAAAATAIVLRQSDPPGQGGETFAPVRSIPYDNPSPVAWYGAGTLYLPHSQVDLLDVRQFAQWDDGAVYLDVRGNLVTVTRDGERDLIATLGPDSMFVVSDVDDRVVWVDPDRAELVDFDLDTGEQALRVALEQDASGVIRLAGDRAYVTAGENLLAVDLTDGTIAAVADWRLPGELDRNGRYVLIREGGGGPTGRIRLYDVAAAGPVRLGMGDTRNVTAAAFGPEGSVVLLVEAPGTATSQVRHCAPPYDDCRLVALFPAGGAPALLPSSR